MKCTSLWCRMKQPSIQNFSRNNWRTKEGKKTQQWQSHRSFPEDMSHATKLKMIPLRISNYGLLGGSHMILRWCSPAFLLLSARSSRRLRPHRDMGKPRVTTSDKNSGRLALRQANHAGSWLQSAMTLGQIYLKQIYASSHPILWVVVFAICGCQRKPH